MSPSTSSSRDRSTSSDASSNSNKTVARFSGSARPRNMATAGPTAAQDSTRPNNDGPCTYSSSGGTSTLDTDDASSTTSSTASDPNPAFRRLFRARTTASASFVGPEARHNKYGPGSCRQRRAALSTTHCGQTAGLAKPRFRAFSFFVCAAVILTATMCVARRSRESQTRPPPATTSCSRSSAGGSVSPSIQTTQPANQFPSVRLRWSSSFRRFCCRYCWWSPPWSPYLSSRCSVFCQWSICYVAATARSRAAQGSMPVLLITALLV
mmetsp:Transcript_2976/g.8915  ORF Transcript_2976/g.8915 Transcript_2976/m.8915 type:complete len:267 (-) Transcript_2976:105-905(-)